MPAPRAQGGEEPHAAEAMGMGAEHCEPLWQSGHGCSAPALWPGSHWRSPFVSLIARSNFSSGRISFGCATYELTCGRLRMSACGTGRSSTLVFPYRVFLSSKVAPRSFFSIKVRRQALSESYNSMREAHFRIQILPNTSRDSKIFCFAAMEDFPLRFYKILTNKDESGQSSMPPRPKVILYSQLSKCDFVRVKPGWPAVKLFATP